MLYHLHAQPPKCGTAELVSTPGKAVSAVLSSRLQASTLASDSAGNGVARRGSGPCRNVSFTVPNAVSAMAQRFGGGSGIFAVTRTPYVSSIGMVRSHSSLLDGTSTISN